MGDGQYTSCANPGMKTCAATIRDESVRHDRRHIYDNAWIQLLRLEDTGEGLRTMRAAEGQHLRGPSVPSPPGRPTNAQLCLPKASPLRNHHLGRTCSARVAFAGSSCDSWTMSPPDEPPSVDAGWFAPRPLALAGAAVG